MPTAVPPSVRILYVLENDALSKRLLTRVAMHALTQACKSARGPVLKENFYLAASRRFSLFVSFYRGSAKGRRMQVAIKVEKYSLKGAWSGSVLEFYISERLTLETSDFLQDL